jgi:uncharacterized damage-inducible protein DinB
MTQRWRTERPGEGEHAPFYAAYIAEVPAGDLVDALERQGAALVSLVRGIPEARGNFRYAEGKWSIKDVLLHVADAERIFGYRALRFARNDETDLPGFDEGLFAKNAGADGRRLADLADELEAIRRSTLALLRPLDDAAMARRGTANGKPITARAIAWIIAGHAEHHMAVLKEKYLE